MKGYGKYEAYFRKVWGVIGSVWVESGPGIPIPQFPPRESWNISLDSSFVLNEDWLFLERPHLHLTKRLIEVFYDQRSSCSFCWFEARMFMTEGHLVMFQLIQPRYIFNIILYFGKWSSGYSSYRFVRRNFKIRGTQIESKQTFEIPGSSYRLKTYLDYPFKDSKPDILTETRTTTKNFWDHQC